MARLESAIDRRSEDFQANARAMEAQLGVLRDKLAAAAVGGSADARQRHIARGKLLARDRIDLLLDPGSPFLEMARSPRTGSTAATRMRRASSPALAGYRGANA